MITRSTAIKNPASFTEAAGLCAPGTAPDRVLFFDIETTGLSASSSYLYLIGCLGIEGGRPTLTQFFSEGPSDEVSLLKAFTEMLKDKEALVHFNGQTFDIPYISHKLSSHNMCSAYEDPFSHLVSCDIYKRLRPYRSLLGCSSMKQKALEYLVGLRRKDPFDGGELIQVYNRYLASVRMEQLNASRMRHSQQEHTDNAPQLTDLGLPVLGASSSDRLLDVLLLHNYEDVLGMLRVSGLLELPDFLKGAYTSEVCGDPLSDESITVILTPRSDTVMRYLPSGGSIPVFSGGPEIHYCSDGRSLTLTVPVYTGELLLFFPNWRDYRYLPAEDRAIHRSVADFLDKSLYKKATAATCYSRCTGRFIPVSVSFAEDNVPVLTSGYRSAARFIGAGDFAAHMTAVIAGYLSCL